MSPVSRSSLMVALAAALVVGCGDSPTEPAEPVESAACGSTVGNIAVGDTVNGVLTLVSCRLSDDTFADRWRFVLAAPTIVTIDLTSLDFDAYLFVRNEEGLQIAFDDDGGDDLDARITRGFAAGTYFIMANAYDPGFVGAYTLSVK